MSKRFLLIIALGVLLFSSVLQAQVDEYYFKFAISSHDELNKITNVISIDNVKGDTVYAYANPREYVEFGKMGYNITLLPNPSSLISPKMVDSPGLLTDWDAYPTYTAYVAMMDSFAIRFPALCQIIDIGATVQGRHLLAAKISANVNIQENEPEVFYASSMHGDEVTGYVLMLRLINYLLTNYATDPNVAYLLNNMEIYICPASNPDGTYHGGNNTVNGATRSNANGVDLNRNFPDPANGPHPDGNAWQVENIAMMNFMATHSFTLSANFHGGAEVVNYPWDSFARLNPDDSWWITLSRQYADTVHHHAPSGYMDDFNNGITNGYAWYPVHGGRQDYMTYFKGGRETTIELSSTKILPPAQLPAYWNYNWISLINYISNALFGIRGIVTDANTGQPVAAMIWVLNHDADSTRVFTDPDVGDYHRLIAPGTYNVRFSATGYVTQTVNGIVVTSNNTTTVNVQLQPLSSTPDLAFSSQNAGPVDPGDTVSMLITLVNSGGGAATGASAVLSSEDSYINIIQNSSSYPTINALGGMGVSQTAYRYAVSPICPRQHQATFRLNITASGGYADTSSFSIIIGQDIENFESGNFSSYPWQFGGNANWTIVSSGAYEGLRAAKSGVIGNSQNSETRVTVRTIQTGPISFYFKVSSEADYDSLKFYIDNTLLGGWSGEISWAQASFSVSAGSHTFKWVYAKDGSQVGGSDCAWIDYIVFPPLAQAIHITTTSLPNWTANFPYSQQLHATGGNGTITWSDLNSNLVGTGLSLSTSGLISGTVAAGTTISFTARAQDPVSVTADMPYSFIINAPLNITSDVLAEGMINMPYTFHLAATGGTGARSYSDANNGLAGTGLTLSSDGVLSGTPTIVGAVSFLAGVTDSIGASTTRTLGLVINGDYIPGDANSDGVLRGSDVTYLISYFKGIVPAPSPYLAGDVNGDCQVLGSDVTYLVRYFKGFNPAPVRGNCP